MDREVRVMTLEALELRQDEDGPRTLRGHAAVFDSDSRPIMGMFVERIAPGAFARALKEKQDVRALRDHNPSQVLGRTASGTLRLSEDERGLMVENDLPSTSYADDLVESVERGDVDQMSFAFRAKKEEWQDGAGPDGMDLRIVLDVDLFDVSVVTYPAYEDTRVAVRMHDEWRSAEPGKDNPKPPEPASEADPKPDLSLYRARLALMASALPTKKD